MFNLIILLNTESFIKNPINGGTPANESIKNNIPNLFTNPILIFSLKIKLAPELNNREINKNSIIEYIKNIDINNDFKTYMDNITHPIE
jgi:hypothetical protein